MKKHTYSKILMAPLFMLLAIACSPNQFNQSTEYDDVYFTASDRTAERVSSRKAQAALVESQEQAAAQENYSSERIDEKIVSKYNNGENDQVTYFEDGPLVKSASDLNYDDFVVDYQNEQLAYYELPLDWDTDWDRNSFNSIMNRDFYFRTAWYDQYYRGQTFRMNQYLAGSFGGSGRRGILGGPTVGLSVGFNSLGFGFGFSNMAIVDLNPWGFYDPFWRPIRGWNRWNRGWFGFNGWYPIDPFYCPPFYNTYNSWGWRGGWNNNVYVNNNIFVDRRADRILTATARSQDVVRGPRVGTSRIATVRNDAVNGTAPSTRSARYVDNIDGNRSSRTRSRAGVANTGRVNSSNSVVRSTGRSGISNGRTNRVRTGAYRFDDGNRSGRSSYVRNYSSSGRSAGSQTRAVSRNNSRSGDSNVRSRNSRSLSSPSFNRGSSSRSYTNLNSSSRNSRSSFGSARGSSSRSSYSRGYSNSSRGSLSRGSSSRGSSGRSSYSRGSSSSSRGSISRGSSSRSSSGSFGRSSGSSRSSGGSVSRGSSGGGSRSGGGSVSSGSSRSGRGN